MKNSRNKKPFLSEDAKLFGGGFIAFWVLAALLLKMLPWVLQ